MQHIRRLNCRFSLYEAFTLTIVLLLLLLLLQQRINTQNTVKHTENVAEPVPQKQESCQYLPSVCSNITCGAQFLANYSSSRSLRIPAIRHVMWKNASTSNYMLQHLKSWLRIHPNWTYILWQAPDLAPFVQKYFPGKVWRKFKSLPPNSMYQIDMFRYLILYKFGGVYADMDYKLIASLDEHRRYPAVVTREAEVQAAGVFGLREWPIPILTSNALMMSEPSHSFFQFCLQQVCNRKVEKTTGFLDFAGPIGLREMLMSFMDLHKYMLHTDSFVYIPPSRSFYPFNSNRLSDSKHTGIIALRAALKRHCRDPGRSKAPQVVQFCENVENLDPIMDKAHPIIAIHDTNRTASTYTNPSAKEFIADMKNILKELPNVKPGSTLI